MAKRTTLLKEGRGELTEKRSVFIGYAAPVQTEAEAIEFVAKIKKKHADARHNVYAYMLKNGAIARYSDDGEPQGTGGIPVLDIIKKGGFCDAAIVVTRYFGGILLGTGGLVRAYSGAAREAVLDAGIVTYDTFSEISLTCSYTDHGKLTPTISEPYIICDGIEYADNVILRLAMPQDELDAFCQRVSELTAGRVRPTLLGTRFDRIVN